MHGFQNLRFIGGNMDGEKLSVHFKVDDVINGGSRYSRREVVVEGVQSFYVETCMVAHGTSDTDAKLRLHLMLREDGPVIPTQTKPLMVTPESSLIHSLAYEDKCGALEVTFKNKKTGEPSGTYRYAGVPKEVLADMLLSESLGGFYCERIRQQYPCVKL